ncbi:MAG TPA: PVC-type heme-binding CxxCH protein [Humisphaera sp.]|jgi:putative membrane-bound dehydrogenase-like protein|nr:PVC-type heme-binding CxxCH protein [Humisphaera sp.]
MNRLRALFVVSLLCLCSIGYCADSNKPIKPLGRDGKPLNLDFEDGTLKDWIATGDAFVGQPVKGDLVNARKSTDRSGHQGDYWIGGFEVKGDAPTGSLSSVIFTVTHPWASFLIGGGSSADTRVEIVRSDNRVLFQYSGYDREELRPIVVDLSKEMGRDIFIRLVDEGKSGWGHINFDDFEFYDQRPTFANEGKPNAPTELVADIYKYAGIPGEKAAEAMTLADGFKAHLFADEPDVVNPIAFTMDERGRLWVVEGLTYPVRAPEGKGRDRILIFEDEKGGGHFTKRTVFMENLNLVSGIEVGFGGVWVGAAPYLMYIPIDASGDKPAGPPQILLDGFGYDDTHETLNTFCWGPDGWLYGCHGVFTQSYVGKPGTARAQRVHINAGIFRYHPTRHVFERFCEGTSNPWGVDFDEHGQIFIEACVIPHLWHMIQGAHYQRQGGQHDDPYVYDDIKTIADHLHWAKAANPWAANGKSDAAGGGHAHAGMMVYQGGSWPAEYNGKLFMNNIHGARINMDIPEAQGSGFVGHHGKDFILFNDLDSQIVNLRYDQDGSCYMIDWYDKNQCHSPNPAVHDRTTGRIFKLVYGDTKTTQVDLGKLSDLNLATLQLDKHEWLVRTARRVLQERAATGKLDPAANRALLDILQNNPDESRKLRALWALHCTGGLTPDIAMAQLKSDRPYVAAWAIQLLCEQKNASDNAVSEFARLAKESKSAVVRLYVSSALQRIPAKARWDAVTALLSHSEDADDHNLPLMNWWAMEPLCTLDPDRALALGSDTKLPGILSFVVRRIGGMGGDSTDKLITALSKMSDPLKEAQVLQGIRDSLRGQRSVPMPKGWADLEERLTASADHQVSSQARGLGVTFGSEAAIAASRKIAQDSKAPAGDRLTVIASLLSIKDSQLPAILQDLLDDKAVRGAALRGLATYDDPKTPQAIIDRYSSYIPGEQKDALTTLAARPTYASQLLSAVAAGKISSKDFSADIVRQLRTLDDPAIEKQVAQVWGIIHNTPAEKQQRIDRLRRLVEGRGKTPNVNHGRLLFTKTCMQCHTLYDAGGKVGPDLTGSNRTDLAYILENVVDPNAVIPNDYRTTQIETNDGRTILGIVKKEDAKAVTIATATEELLVPLSEIKSRNLTKLSMMPEGLLDQFPNDDVRDLIAYLRTTHQVPLPEGMVEAPASATK